MNILISFTTYPRDGKSTYDLLEKTYKSLFDNQNLTNLHIKILVVGDDYLNIEELKPIFKSHHAEFYNININDALRYKNIPYEVKWKQSVQRSKIFILEKALELEYDYILMSSDDDIYLNKKIETSIQYIKKYNEPDLLFNLGIHFNSQIIPKNEEIYSYPKKKNCISSGIIYKLKNKEFIKTIINFRKSRWEELIKLMKKNKSYKTIMPEDAELWDYLENFFIKKQFTSILIPKILVNHETEGTLKNFI